MFTESSSPRYLLYLEATPEELVLLNQLWTWPYSKGMVFKFNSLTSNLFYTTVNVNSVPLSKVVSSYLGHDNFVLSAICAHMSLIKNLSTR